MNHEEITKIVAPDGYGKGVKPNPFALKQKEWERRKRMKPVRDALTEKIEMLFEPRFITPPETSELIESIVTACDARRVLEVGMCTGFTALHIIRAICGKENAKLFSVDARPAHDVAFFTGPIIGEWFELVEGWTPDVLAKLSGNMFDVVFIDSDHTLDHTVKELGALWEITRPGTMFLFHDVPEWTDPKGRQPSPVREYLFCKVKDGTFQGGVIQTCEQMDCLDAWGSGYPPQCNPGLGVFVRL